MFLIYDLRLIMLLISLMICHIVVLICREWLLWIINCLPSIVADCVHHDPPWQGRVWNIGWQCPLMLLLTSTLLLRTLRTDYIFLVSCWMRMVLLNSTQQYLLLLADWCVWHHYRVNLIVFSSFREIVIIHIFSIYGRCLDAFGFYLEDLSLTRSWLDAVLLYHPFQLRRVLYFILKFKSYLLIVIKVQ